jgi:hypothetical protein
VLGISRNDCSGSIGIADRDHAVRSDWRGPRAHNDRVALKHSRAEPLWLNTLLARSIAEMSGDLWQVGLANAAGSSLSFATTVKLLPELVVALASKGALTIVDEDVRRAWSAITSFEPHHDGPAQLRHGSRPSSTYVRAAPRSTRPRSRVAI